MLLRSAFFAGIHSKKRRILGTRLRPEKEAEGVLIAAQDGYTLKYAGTQLNQYDADVFFEALHRARREHHGAECKFTGASFLKAIGRTRNDLNYDDLDDSLRRLKAGIVDIHWTARGKPYVFTGNLIETVTRETDSKLYKLTFHKEIRTLFAPASWTQLEWEERKALKGKPLAQWLHSYFSTHAKPYPVSVTFLHEKTGSPTALRAHFKPELRKALSSLQDLIGWKVEWDGDLVKVTRPPTESQSRHLSRKAAKRKEQNAGQGTAMPSRVANRRPPARTGDLTSVGNLLSSLFPSRPGAQ